MYVCVCVYIYIHIYRHALNSKQSKTSIIIKLCFFNVRQRLIEVVNRFQISGYTQNYVDAAWFRYNCQNKTNINYIFNRPPIITKSRSVFNNFHTHYSCNYFVNHLQLHAYLLYMPVNRITYKFIYSMLIYQLLFQISIIAQKFNNISDTFYYF